MNHYLNCTPRECREYESVTLDVPTEAVDDILTYARILSDEKNITARKAMTDIVRGVYNELFEKIMTVKIVRMLNGEDMSLMCRKHILTKNITHL
ncbi:MAG: hypothetical protein CM15mV13_2010 [uncultured marine virus]|nr:MAG: hypothetical protein CM15mV13_2010 [uncultured marine virus]